MATATSRSLGGLIVSLVAALALASCGGEGHSPSHHLALAWLHPTAVPTGWSVARLPSGTATLAYPPNWRSIASDPGTVTAAQVGAGGLIVGYLNATPRQANESLSNWSTFRPNHNAHEGDRHVHVLATARAVPFRSGRASCVIDTYRTSRAHYHEIACLVDGRPRHDSGRRRRDRSRLAPTTRGARARDPGVSDLTRDLRSGRRSCVSHAPRARALRPAKRVSHGGDTTHWVVLQDEHEVPSISPPPSASRERQAFGRRGCRSVRSRSRMERFRVGDELEVLCVRHGGDRPAACLGVGGSDGVGLLGEQQIRAGPPLPSLGHRRLTFEVRHGQARHFLREPGTHLCGYAGQPGAFARKLRDVLDDN
jgi:hypothetical protein